MISDWYRLQIIYKVLSWSLLPPRQTGLQLQSPQQETRKQHHRHRHPTHCDPQPSRRPPGSRTRAPCRRATTAGLAAPARRSNHARPARERGIRPRRRRRRRPVAPAKHVTPRRAVVVEARGQVVHALALGETVQPAVVRVRHDVGRSAAVAHERRVVPAVGHAARGILHRNVVQSRAADGRGGRGSAAAGCAGGCGGRSHFYYNIDY